MPIEMDKIYIGALFVSLSVIASSCTQIRPEPKATETLAAPTIGLFDVGGFELYISCRGEGSPVVIIESGLGPQAMWYSELRRTASDLSQTCFYDRQGVGRSEAGRSKTSSKLAAEDLHRLLHEAQIPGPYLFVAHSLGGYNAIMFADMYPDQVAGIVFAESSPLGSDPFSGMATLTPKEVQQERRNDGDNSEGFLELESQEQVAGVSSLGHIPIIVLTAEIGGTAVTEELFPAMQAIYIEEQAKIAALSDRSKHIILEGVGHDLPVSRPDLVVDAIEELLEMIRDG